MVRSPGAGPAREKVSGRRGAALASGSAVRSAVAVSRRARMQPTLIRQNTAMMIEIISVPPPAARTEAKPRGARPAPRPEIW